MGDPIIIWPEPGEDYDTACHQQFGPQWHYCGDVEGTDYIWCCYQA
jgi:hypothetical protein